MGKSEEPDKDQAEAAKAEGPRRGYYDGPIEETMSVDERSAISPAWVVEQRLTELLSSAGDLMVSHLRYRMQRAEREGELETVAGKQKLARTINSECRRHGQTLAHPESGDPCVVLAINDGGSGRFVLENSVTKKRSHTTKNAADLPLKAKPIPPEKQD